MRLRDLSRCTAVVAGLLFAAVSLAQQAVPVKKTAGPASPPRNPNQVVGNQNFGTTDLIYVRSQGLDFYPYRSDLSGYVSSGNLRWGTFAGIGLEAALHVPSGAIIDYLELDACDTNAAKDMSIGILDCDPTGFLGCVDVSSINTTGSGGCVPVSVSAIGYQVDNATHSINFEAIDNAGDGSLAIASAVVGYHLQVSPAPGSPTFGDVPADSIYFPFIEALAAAGVTGGCDLVPNFCPERPVTRQEMAVFMAKALGLHFPN